MTSFISVLPSSRCVRAIAWLSAMLVAVLSLGSASPALHAWLHGRGSALAHTCPYDPSPTNDAAAPTDAAHVCAVTLFSQGVMTEAMAMVTRACGEVRRASDRYAIERPIRVRPRYLHQPPQAPPAA